jgi:chaperonin GroES
MSYLPEDTDIRDLVDEVNVADRLDEDCLKSIGHDVVDCFKMDEESRTKWLDRYVKSLKIAMQVQEEKTYPWPKASNVKFPEMTLASITFHARAYPMLVPSKDLVNVKTIGPDTLGFKRRRAERIKTHMNYQFLDQIKEWEPEMDRLLLTLPITGTEFKKTYYNASLGRNTSCFVFAKDLVIDYYAKSLATAERKTEILSMSLNEIQEKVNAGVFTDPDFNEGSPRDDKTTQVSDQVQGKSRPATNKYAPRMVLECHCYWDLDGDGYNEPYIITVDKESEKVLRIVARFEKDNVEVKNGKVIKITPEEYYTKYEFIPSPDGGFYGIGFGNLIGPINEAISSIINQLIDAGSLSNLQSGFITRSFKQKGGTLSFEPGEWKLVPASMQDLREGIYPLPVREPSNVLFQLLGLLIDVGQKITSTTDILVGENPGQNQKATTTQAVVENGMRVFTAIYKRLRYSMSCEIERMYDLNRRYLDEKEYFSIVDPEGQDAQNGKIMRVDYEDESMDVVPTADPNAVSPMQKLMRAQALLEVAGRVPGINMVNVLKRYYDALEIENPEEVLPDPKVMNQPPMEAMLKDRELSIEEQNVQGTLLLKEREVKRKELEALAKVRQGDEKLDLEHVESHREHLRETARIMSDHSLGERKVEADKQKAKQGTSS